MPSERDGRYGRPGGDAPVRCPASGTRASRSATICDADPGGSPAAGYGSEVGCAEMGLGLNHVPLREAFPMLREDGVVAQVENLAPGQKLDASRRRRAWSAVPDRWGIRRTPGRRHRKVYALELRWVLSGREALVTWSGDACSAVEDAVGDLAVGVVHWNGLALLFRP
jgi:hypothetical protein